MAIFAPKPWVKPFAKMSIFRLFELLVFIPFKGGFSLPFLNNNHGFTPLENVNFSTFQSFCFYSLERRFFVLECRKRHFPSLYFLKKKIGKIGIIRPKPWVKPFGKIWIFGLFELLVVTVYKSVFFLLLYRKRHFPGLYCLKKKS